MLPNDVAISVIPNASTQCQSRFESIYRDKLGYYHALYRAIGHL